MDRPPTEVIDVREAVNAALLEVEPQLSARRLDSVGDILPGILVLAEREKLRGILLTLLSNAIRFASRGGYVMVDVGYPLNVPEELENTVMLRVGDNGQGIARERQEEIFAPAPSGEESVRPPLTGPGLAVSRQWAREMNGNIRVRSEEGNGSVFTLVLPRAG
ncbi:MAG TPA: ATP-binding protein [Gemmatimonadaceae bacterium]